MPDRGQLATGLGWLSWPTCLAAWAASREPGAGPSKDESARLLAGRGRLAGTVRRASAMNARLASAGKALVCVAQCDLRQVYWSPRLGLGGFPVGKDG